MWSITKIRSNQILFGVLLLLLSGFNMLQAQQVQSAYEKGNILFNINKFNDAIPFYLKELETTHDPAFAEELTFRLAECYRITGQHTEAEKVYRKLYLKNKKAPRIMYNYGVFLRGIGKYKEAKVQFQAYSALRPDDSLAIRQIISCDSAMKWASVKSNYYVREVKELNSTEPDFSPLVWGNQLYFVSSKQSASQTETDGTTTTKQIKGKPAVKGKKIAPDEKALEKPLPTLDMMSTYQADSFTTAPTPENFSGLVNMILDEGPAAINAEGTEMYFTRPSEEGVKNKEENLIENKLVIVHAQKAADGSWITSATDFPWNNPKLYSVAHPTLSADGKTMVFTSDMDGGYGGTDLYVCTRNGDTWSEPQNLGPGINTPGYELFPYLRDNGTLYFSSDMHPGLGNLDIFSVTYDQSKSAWGKVTNLKPPVNSSYDDFGISFVKGAEKGFFSSKRPTGTGDDDIYSFIGNKELKLTYNGNEFSVQNEFFYDQLTYTIHDKETGKDSVLKGDRSDIRFRIEPNKHYTLKALRGKDKVHSVDLYYGVQADSIFNLEFKSENVPVKLQGYIRSATESKDAKSILSAGTYSKGVSGLKLNIVDSLEQAVQQSTTDTNGAFSFPVAFAANKPYILSLRDEHHQPEREKPVQEIVNQTTSSEPIVFKGRAIVVETGKALSGVKVSLFKGTQEVARTTNSKDGRIQFSLDRQETYTVVASKEGYFTQQLKISTYNKPTITAIEEVLAMQLLKRDTSIHLIDIYYDFAKASLRPESKKVLMRMYQFLKDNDSIAIELMSHTDEVGTDTYNMLLSQKRAESVVNFLIEKGIPRDRLLAVGYGESTPKVRGAANAKDHQLNRRTEFQIISMKDIPNLMAMHQKRIATYEANFKKELDATATLPAEPTYFTVPSSQGTGGMDGIVKVKQEKGIVYKVQIASSETELPPDYFSGFKRVEML
ncbi:MAG: OmpA family protein, partial [Bacteroidia bacterium]|nr:OmpA family protein [Bacteroidia bacterium]